MPRSPTSCSATSEPGGRLPFTVPRDEADLPPFDKNATTVTYDRWHGQRLLDRHGIEAAYPLGFGLSYTSFTIDEVEVTCDRDAEVLQIRASVENTGSRRGGQVLQVYATRPESGERFLDRVRASRHRGWRAGAGGGRRAARAAGDLAGAWQLGGPAGRVPHRRRASAADPASYSDAGGRTRLLSLSKDHDLHVLAS